MLHVLFLGCLYFLPPLHQLRGVISFSSSLASRVTACLMARFTFFSAFILLAAGQVLASLAQTIPNRYILEIEETHDIFARDASPVSCLQLFIDRSLTYFFSFIGSHSQTDVQHPRIARSELQSAPRVWLPWIVGGHVNHAPGAWFPNTSITLNLCGRSRWLTLRPHRYDYSVSRNPLKLHRSNHDTVFLYLGCGQATFYSWCQVNNTG